MPADIAASAGNAPDDGAQRAAHAAAVSDDAPGTAGQGEGFDAAAQSRVERALFLMEFETTLPQTLGAREEAIRRRLHITPTRYYQELNRALDVPAVFERYPVQANRLLRRRDARAQGRAVRRAQMGEVAAGDHTEVGD